MNTTATQKRPPALDPNSPAAKRLAHLAKAQAVVAARPFHAYDQHGMGRGFATREEAEAWAAKVSGTVA